MTTAPRFEPSDESDLWPEDEPDITPEFQRETYLGRAKSGYTKVRHTFVQTPPAAKRGSTPSTLAAFGRNHRAAVLYLAVLANWPWLSREAEPLPSGSWIRFLQCEAEGSLTWTPQSLSHAWKTLEDLGLVLRPRKGRLLAIEPRREDGKAAYTPPDGANGDSYWVLPNEFWTQELHGTLSWPGLAVLLVLLKETNGRRTAELAIDRAKAYYGLGRTTVEAGLTELRKLGIVDSRDRFVRDADTGDGRRRTSVHMPLGPFSMEARAALRGAAADRMAKRSAKKAGPKTKSALKPRKPRAKRRGGGEDENALAEPVA